MKRKLLFLVLFLFSISYSFSQVTAGFTWTFTNGGCAPENVVFTNTSTGAVSYEWDFDDWTGPYFCVDTTYPFMWGDAYNVQLIAYDGMGDSAIYSELIVINDPPFASFNSMPSVWTEVCFGDEIEFTNSTWPSVDSTQWIFGDNDTAFTFNATHTYATVGTYDFKMVVFNSCGTDTMYHTINVTNTAQPFASIWANPTTICPGEEVSFTNWSSGNIVLYEWDFDEDWVTDSNDETPPAMTFMTTTDVTLIAHNNCTNDTAYMTITVDPTLTPWVSAFADRDSVCLGQEINYTSNGDRIIAYDWDFDDGGTSSAQNTQYTHLATGDYTVTFTGYNLCGNSSSVTIDVVVDNSTTPDPAFFYDPWDPCPGTTISFTNNSSDTDYYVFWDFGDGNTSTDVDPTHSYAALGSYDVKLIVENLCGVRDSITQTINVVSDGMPWAAWNSMPGTWMPICMGTEVQFENFSSDTSDCLWDFGDGNTSTEANPSHTFATEGFYTVLLTVTNSCGNSNTAWPQTFNVRTDVPPTADFWMWPNSVCPGEEMDFWNNSSDPDASEWDFGDGGTSTEANPTYSWSTPGTYDVQLVVANACGTDTIVQQINVKTGSVADFVSDAPVCLGDVMTFTDMSSNSPDVWTWDFGDGNTDIVQNPTHTYAAPGVYNVQLNVIKNSCADQVDYLVEVIEVTSTISGTDALCNGSCDGTATIVPADGVSPYSYLWSDGQTTQTAVGLCAGSYSVTITDVLGCTATNTVVIGEPTAITISFTDIQPLCNGDCNGEIDLTVGGGTPGYTYWWSPIASTVEDPTGLCAGSYIVTVTDANACTATDTHVLGEPSMVLATISGTTNPTCFGSCDGDATVVGAGGTPGYTYLWGTGGTGATETGLCSGATPVTVTDANGCQATTNANLTDPPALTLTMTHVDANCGLSDGSATVAAVNNGTAPYTYDWTPDGFTGDGTATYSDLPSGSYDVDVVDANGCTVSETVNISDLGGPVIAIDSQTDATCFGYADGEAQVSAAGGTMPYTFNWSTGGTGAIETGLAAGTYSVTVIDANTCQSSTNVVIGEPAEITLSFNVTDASCNGMCDGEAEVVISNGVAPFTFIWSDAQTTQIATALCAASFDVTVTDVNGCNATGTAVINEPASLTASITSTVDNICFGDCLGEATVTPVGGIGPYSYLWDDGQTTQIATGLCAGSYDVTVTDANGCEIIETATILEPAQIVITETITDASCGTADGEITVVVAGGTPPYTYLWSTGGTTDTETGLLSGSYGLTVTDANGCIETVTYAVSDIGGPTASIASQTDASCFGICDGEATVAAVGGTPPYTYLWSTGGTTDTETGLCAGDHPVTVTDDNGCQSVLTVTIAEPLEITLAFNTVDPTCNGNCDGEAEVLVTNGVAPFTYAWDDASMQTTQTATGLCAGLYNVTVTDDNGCTATASVNIIDPAIITATIISTVDILCNGDCTGEATVDAAGGTAPYTYLWDDGQTTLTATGLCVGSWTVEVTDVYGCTVDATATINEPTAMVIIETITNSSCGTADGEISVVVTDGTPGYTYNWSTGDNTATASGLIAGSYNLTVTDANGCTEIVTYAVSDIGGPTLSIATQIDVDCFGDCNGSVDIDVTGGTAPYTYLWSDGSTTEDVSGLCAGTYTLTTTDDASCISTIVVDILEPTELTAVLTSTDDNGTDNGTATATPSGGTPPYTYLWNTSDTDADITGLTAGWYTVTVTDDNGCIFVDSVEVLLNTSIDPITEEQTINIYPNPSHGLFNMELAGMDQDIEIVVYSISGQVIYNARIENGTTIFQLDLQGQAEGMYFIKFNGKDLNRTEKVIIR